MVPDKRVLDRDGKCMPEMKLTGNIRRREQHGESASWRPLSVLRLLPEGVGAGFDLGGVEGFRHRGLWIAGIWSLWAVGMYMGSSGEERGGGVEGLDAPWSGARHGCTHGGCGWVGLGWVVECTEYVSRRSTTRTG